MIINIRIIRILADRLLEALERFLGFTLLHMHARQLDQTLRQGRHEFQRRLQVGFRAGDVRVEELVRSAEVESFRFEFVGGETLFEGFADSGEGVSVVAGC